MVGDLIMLKDSVGDTAGGQFAVYKEGVYQLETFCVEYTEHINFSSTFRVAGINDFATSGGAGGAIDGKDYLSDETRWLFYHFSNGTLDDLVSGYSYGDIGNANALQKAIWYWENETNGQYNFLAEAAFNAIEDDIETGGIGQVKVLNLVFNSTGGVAQDQLYVVPEPLSMLLFGTGLIGIGAYVKRRFR
jgi:hypothetical protein